MFAGRAPPELAGRAHTAPHPKRDIIEKVPGHGRNTNKRGERKGCKRKE